MQFFLNMYKKYYIFNGASLLKYLDYICGMTMMPVTADDRREYSCIFETHCADSEHLSSKAMPHDQVHPFKDVLN